MARYRVAVGEFDPELRSGSQAWNHLARSLERASPDLLLLCELSFGQWLSSREEFDPDLWQRSIEAHQEGVAALGELGVPVVLGSRSIEIEGLRCNESFVWTPTTGAIGVHTKQHIPDSPGYRETTWYQQGERHFRVVEAGSLALKIGFLNCTDVMFSEHARHYGRDGAELIVVPRVSPPLTATFFRVAIQMAAVCSGCYVASSNRTGIDSVGEQFEGAGYVVDPLGEIVARTSLLSPLVVHDIDTDFVAWKRPLYPCNVAE